MKLHKKISKIKNTNFYLFHRIKKVNPKMNPNNSNKVNSYFNPGAGNSLTDAHTSNNKQPSITNSRFRSNPPRPYPRTDFSFLNSNSNLVKDPSKPAPNIYGKTNSNHLLKTSKLNINHQKNESHQSEREKFFAEYIKNNGDAASQIIPNFLYIGGHKSVINVPNLLTDKVTHVLNMAGELNLDFVEMDKCNIKLLNVLAKDSKNYNIRKDFDLTFQFIDDCLRSRGKFILLEFILDS